MRQHLPSRTLLQHSAPQSPDQPSPLPFSRDDAAPSSPAASPEIPDLDSHISSSMAIIMVVLLTAFFFMGFFSVYLKRCTTQNEISSNNRAAATRRQPPEQGLDPAVLESLPMVFYSTVKTTREGKELAECSVCLNEFEDSEPLRLLPKCRHYFHPECIDMWLYSHTTCPLCRRSLLERLGSFRWPGWGSLRGSRSVRNEDSHDGNPALATEVGEARVTLDNRIAGIDQARNLSQLREGASSARSWPRGQNLNDVEACRIHDSAILGLMKSASTSSPNKGMTRFRSELRRSRSTGHSLVKRVFSRASLFLPGSSLSDNLNEGQPLSRSLPLESSGRAGLRRSKSHAMVSQSLSREEEEDNSCSRRAKRSISFKRACSLRRSPQEVIASNMGEQASSPGSRRTFERLVVIDL